ncbi:MAG: alkaline phosphatase family protein [Dermatophilaceae bacterium]
MTSTGDAAGSGPVLADVLPGVARSIGVPWPPPGSSARRGLELPPARRAVVVLIDGLGHDLLIRRAGHAPWLRHHLASTVRATCGFPSTTATSVASFGTGLLAGAHGLVGYEAMDPDTGRVLNELSWEDGPDPRRWQPFSTVYEAAAASGVDVVHTGPAFFEGSGLTVASSRGGRFVAAGTLPARVDVAVAAARASPSSLVYVYWGELDKVGHVHGCTSWQWGEQLETIDRELARLADALPDDCSLTITADHGMVDVPQDARVDVAADPRLAAGVEVVSSEPRAPHLWVAPGAVADVLAAWRAVLGSRAEVVERDDAVARGWFGEVRPEVRGRIGDVVVTTGAAFAVVDSRRARPELLALIGLHGSLTDDEVSVPVLHVPASAVAPG